MYNTSFGVKLKKDIKMEATKLQYSTREINRDFKIKVYGYTEEGAKVDTLVGVGKATLI